MIHRLAFILVSILIFSGCSTLNNRLSQITPGESYDNVIKSVGKPQKRQSANSIVLTKYSAFCWKNMEHHEYSMYFRDNTLAAINKDENAFQQLDTWYSLGLISKEEYESKNSMLSQRMAGIAQVMAATPPVQFQPYTPSPQPQKIIIEHQGLNNQTRQQTHCRTDYNGGFYCD